MDEFSNEELKMIQSIRNINNDQTLDTYECLAAYIEIMGE